MHDFLVCLSMVLLGAFTWRVRGGLRIPGTDKKFPLNKWWFAVFYALATCYMEGWSWNLFFVMLIASRLCSQLYGWGEYVGCLICGSKPYPERSDCDLVDDIVDNAQVTIKGTTYKLTDFPVLWGWIGLSLRGLILSFIVGLALNSIPYMLCGFAMGTVYWLAGQFNKHVIDDGKCGWKWSEYAFGAYLGVCLYIALKLLGY